MCGRFYLQKMLTVELFEHLFGFPLQRSELPYVMDRDILPYRDITVIYGTEEQTAASRPMFWNLIPKNSPEFKPRRTWFNTRKEKLEEPYQRSLLQYRRCAIPVNGFYENKKVNQKPVYHSRKYDGKRVRKKETYEFVHEEQPIMLLGGIYERWNQDGGDDRYSCCIITQSPNSLIGEIHDRMPFILPPGTVKTWLDRRIDDPALLLNLITPVPSEKLKRICVWPPAEEPPPQFDLFN